MIARRGRPATRDALMEALWPGEGPQRTGNRLSVALSTLRSVLDPEHRIEPEPILATGEGVALMPGALGLDVEEFLDAAAEGLRLHREGQSDDALALLELAEMRFAGDFFEQDIYEDWAAGLREEARAS